MNELKFKNDPVALERLAKAQEAIDKFAKAHPKKFTEKESKVFRGLLKERAAALSEATGMKIHSLFD